MFSLCLGLITGFAEAFLVKILRSIVVCVFFCFEVGNLYQSNVDRQKLSTSENGVLCGFINILSQALYNLFLCNQLILISVHSSLLTQLNLYSETSS